MTIAGAQAADAGIAVERYAGDRAAWDAFVGRTPGGTFFHQIGWKDVLEQVFGYTAHYLVARRGDAIAGVLPLYELRAPFMERRLLSLPFAVEGGVCSDDPAAQAALDRAALALGRDCGARHLELRDALTAPGFQPRAGRYSRFRRALHGDEEAEFAALPRKRRNMIRRAQRNGLTADVAHPDPLLFHHLYAQTARRFGTPVFPARFFRVLLQRFPQSVVMLTVRCAGVPAAAALMLLFGETACPYYAGSRREFFHYAVNDFLYWELMRCARQRGARVFDFGRSKVGTGAHLFKCLWGFHPEPLRYRVYAFGADGAPDRSSSDAHLQRLQRVWRHLPLSLTKLLGPFFVRRYGVYYT